MAEYINREDLITACKKTHYAVNANDHPYDVAARVGKYFRKCVDEAPAADVVEVVRCKDCRYCEERHYEEEGEKPYIKLSCKWSNYSHQPNDYCSLGERN